MPKIKTHKGAAKRFDVTGTGKLTSRKAGKRHILTKKSTKRKRGMRQTNIVAAGDVGLIKQMLPNL